MKNILEKEEKNEVTLFNLFFKIEITKKQE